MKTKRGLALAKGQIWQLKHVYIYIVKLGYRLLYYQMKDSLAQQGVKTQTSGVDVMMNYLRTRHARLVSVAKPGPGGA